LDIHEKSSKSREEHQLIKVKRRTYINSSKSREELLYVAPDPDFIALNWRKLLLHFYKESKDYIKNITETKKKIQETLRVLRTSMILHYHHHSSLQKKVVV
jgi:hypothetical protein